MGEKKVPTPPVKQGESTKGGEEEQSENVESDQKVDRESARIREIKTLQDSVKNT